MQTKTGLTERSSKAGGTRVRQTGGVSFLNEGETLVIKDLMERKSYNKPDRVGVGPRERGIAWSVQLTDLELA